MTTDSLKLEVNESGMVIRRHELENGLAILALADRSAPLISYQTWFNVGSRHEQEGATGMAHLFEHLMFNATRSRPQGEFDRLIERTGGDSNAATWVDWTYYRCTLPARDLELAVELESDRMENLLLAPKQLESERDVVIHERLLRVEDEVDGFLDEELFRLAFDKHPYHWPTIGWMKDIRAITLEQVQEFYRTHYSPNNATIVVVGDFDESELLRLVNQKYGHLPASDHPAEEEIVEPPQTAEKRATYEKPVTAPRMLWGYRSCGQEEPDWAALSAVATLLTSGPSSRLHRELVVESELAITVDAGTFPFRDPSLFRVSANLTRGSTPAEVEERIEHQLSRLAEEDVSAEELDKVRNGVETDFWAELETCDGRGEALGHYEVTLGDFRKLFSQAKALAAVTAEDLRRVAGTYLTRDRSTKLCAAPLPDGEGDDQ